MKVNAGTRHLEDLSRVLGWEVKNGFEYSAEIVFILNASSEDEPLQRQEAASCYIIYTGACALSYFEAKPVSHAE